MSSQLSAPGNHSTDRDHQDINQPVLDFAAATGRSSSVENSPTKAFTDMQGLLNSEETLNHTRLHAVNSLAKFHA